MTASDHVIRAAGAVLWRRIDGDVEVALVHRPRYDDWSHPKGKTDPGETPQETACREVLEETGFTGRLGPSLGVWRYTVDDTPKEVRYWALQAAEGEFMPNDEVDRLEWVDVATAHARLTRSGDRDVLAAFVAAVDDA